MHILDEKVVVSNQRFPHVAFCFLPPLPLPTFQVPRLTDSQVLMASESDDLGNDLANIGCHENIPTW